MTETKGTEQVERRGAVVVGYLSGGLAGVVPSVRQAVELAVEAADVPEWLAAVVAGGGWDRLVAVATLVAGVVGIVRGARELVRRFGR